MERFLRLDNGEKPGLAMRLHRLRCPRCREESAALEKHFQNIAAIVPSFTDRDMSESVLDILRHTKTVHGKKVATYQWASAECTIIASLVLVQFSDAKIYLVAHLGDAFHLLISASLGIAITLFSAVAVMTHLDELNVLRKRFEVFLKR
jgi:hypothetical protein